MNWYYASKGEKHGPFTDEELFRHVEGGRINPEDLVWNPSMGEEWVLAKTIPELSIKTPIAVGGTIVEVPDKPALFQVVLAFLLPALMVLYMLLGYLDHKKLNASKKGARDITVSGVKRYYLTYGRWPVSVNQLNNPKLLKDGWGGTFTLESIPESKDSCFIVSAENKGFIHEYVLRRKRVYKWKVDWMNISTSYVEDDK